MRSPMDIPCRVCGAKAGAPCVYMFHTPRLHMQLPGYHSDRKYVDYPVAQAAFTALTE